MFYCEKNIFVNIFILNDVWFIICKKKIEKKYYIFERKIIKV